jgi:hypothetical protein
MPSYSFRNNDTNEEFDMSMSNSERELFLQTNPNIIQIFKRFPGIGDPTRLGIRKPDDNFRDVLKNVKHHHKKDNINTW